VIGVSGRFRVAVAGSHRVGVEVVVVAGERVVSAPLPVVGGSVTLDRTAASFGRLSVDVAAAALAAGDVLGPYGFELRVQRGVVYADGSRELVPLGVFPIQSSDVSVSGSTVKVDALDRSQFAREAKLLDVHVVAAGTNYGVAIRDLIEAGVPGLSYAFASTEHVTPSLQFAAGADRWATAQTMAAACGMDLWFDGWGVCTLSPARVPSMSPDWVVSDGPGGVLVDASLQRDRGPAYNGVVVSSAAPGASVSYRSVALDLEPSSPTYWYSTSPRFGQKPMFFTSPLVTSQAMCDEAAAALLAERAGVSRSVSFATWPDPSRRPGDSVLVRSVKLGLNEVHVVDGLTVPLTAKGRMTARTRVVSR